MVELSDALFVTVLLLVISVFLIGFLAGWACRSEKKIKNKYSRSIKNRLEKLIKKLKYKELHQERKLAEQCLKYIKKNLTREKDHE
ncbi:hypothetical protein J7L67_01985 [bacterium]|nr:hypothetical protein [bacterium]